MPRLVVISREGEERAINAQTGMSLMENLRDAGVDELIAICGGCVSCATCHVFIDTPAGAPELGEEEQGLLEMSLYRQGNSRLSCQVIVTENFDGMRVTIAPED